MDPTLVSATILFAIKNETKYDGKWVYLEVGPETLDGVYDDPKTRSSLCWWWLSSRNDQTVAYDVRKEKAKYVARVGKDFAKIFAGGAFKALCGGLAGGLGGAIDLGSASVVPELAIRGLDARGAVEGGTGFMKTKVLEEAQKEWVKDLRYFAKGKPIAQDVAFEHDFVCGGCAVFKPFVRGSVLLQVKVLSGYSKFRSYAASKFSNGGGAKALAALTLEYLDSPTFSVAISPDDRIRRV